MGGPHPGLPFQPAPQQHRLAPAPMPQQQRPAHAAMRNQGQPMPRNRPAPAALHRQALAPGSAPGPVPVQVPVPATPNLAPDRKDAKTELMQFCQRYCQRPTTKDDIVYTNIKCGTQYQATVRLQCLNGQEYAGALAPNQKEAEKKAAAQALLAHKKDMASLPPPGTKTKAKKWPK